VKPATVLLSNHPAVPHLIRQVADSAARVGRARSFAESILNLGSSVKIRRRMDVFGNSRGLSATSIMTTKEKLGK